MTLLNLTTEVKKHFEGADISDVRRLAGELEMKLCNEIFSPHGIECPGNLSKRDVNEPLLLDDCHISLYLDYIFAVLSREEADIEAANAFSTLFNQRLSELAVYMRRNNLPVKNTPLKGGI